MATLGTNGSAGTLSATTSETTANIAPSGSSVLTSTVCVKAASANSANVLVRFSNLHKDSDFSVLEAGDTRYFRVNTPCTLTYKSASGTQSIHVDACVAG